MTEPKKIPLDPDTPRIKSVKKIPMPSAEQELHALIEESKDYLTKKQAVRSNFIKKGKESVKKYKEKLNEK